MRWSAPGARVAALGLALLVASTLPAPAGAAGSVPVAGPTRLAAEDTRSAGPRHCRFETPAAWTQGTTIWVGACRSGFAHGYGVIVDEVAGNPTERFYGRLSRGYLRRGALQVESGYLAGQWSGGVLAPAREDDQAARNELIQAFDAAAKAASVVSHSTTGRQGAARRQFYADQARRFRMQMD